MSSYFSSDEDEESWLNEVTDFEDDEDPDYFPLKAHSTQHSQSSDNDDSFSQSSAPAKNVSLRQYSSASNKVSSITSDTNEPCCSYTETLSYGENSVCSQSDGNPPPNLLGFHDACTPVHEVTEPASSSSIECDLHKGEDVLLKYENFSIFKAAFLTIDSEPLQGQFAVEQLLRDTNQWKDFDPDKHAPASIVKWPLNKVDKLPFPIVEDLGTEARQPTLLDTRKRIRNEQSWQKNIKKTKYNAGEEYQFKNKKGETFTKPSRKELKEEKCCNSSCRQQCSDNFGPEDVKKINKHFWDLKDYDLQKAYLIKYVSVQEQKQRVRIRKTSKTGKRKAERKPNKIFSLATSPEEATRVCKTFFLYVLNINMQRVETALKSAASSGFIAPDGRKARSGTRNAASNERVETVVNHMKMFPTVEAHYVRQNEKYEYLPQGLSIKMM